MRASKNFRNVIKTCSVRHQRGQLSLAYGGIFPRRIVVPADSPYLKQKGGNFSDNAISPDFVEVWGTNYEHGDILVQKVESFGILKIGVIKSIIVDGEKVYFVCNSFKSELRGGLFVSVGEPSPSISEINELADYHPLRRIGSLDRFSFVLHHFISDNKPI